MVPGYRERPRQHPAAVERPGHPGVRPGGVQRRRLRRRRSARRPSPRTSARSSTRRTPRRRARSCGCSSSTSSSPARCATSSTRCCRADFDLRQLPERVIFQLNDTHPVIAIPELMRILVDERGLDWDEAWAITQQCFAYTCHTLLPEALEVWPVELLGRLLPRHLEIIYRINDEFLAELREAYPDDELRVRRMSIIQEHPERAVRMAYLATVAGSKVNGVAELHRQLLRDKVLPDFSDALAGQVHQRHQRRHPAPVRAAGQPGPLGADHRRHRRRLAHRPGAAARSSSRSPTTPASGTRSARSRRRNKTGLADLLQRRDGIVLPDRRHVRRDGQAAARVQAADPQAAARRHAVPADPGRTRASTT